MIGARPVSEADAVGAELAAMPRIPALRTNTAVYCDGLPVGAPPDAADPRETPVPLA